MYVIHVQSSCGLMHFLDEYEGIRDSGIYTGEVINGVLQYGDRSYDVAAPVLVNPHNSPYRNRIKVYKTVAEAKKAARKLYDKLSDPKLGLSGNYRVCKYTVTVVGLETPETKSCLYSNVVVGDFL